jgi:hypothetical protein
MWESKDNALNATYNADHIWFDGIGGQHTQKPADIRKWEDSKQVQAHRETISQSQSRQTFKMNTKGENVEPLAFQSDPEGI